MNTGHWADLAACKIEDPENLYPLGDGTHSVDQAEKQAARDICVGMKCPVINDCLKAALEEESKEGLSHGVRGGLSANQRRTIVNAQRATGPRGPKAGCGTPGGYSSHRRDETPICDPCRRAEAKRAHEYNVTRRAALAGGAA